MDSFKIHYKDQYAALKLGEFLSKYIMDPSAFFFLGSDKCIADSLGPLSGTMLKNNSTSINIFGTLKHPIHALNLQKYINIINQSEFQNIIAVDSSLSHKSEIGFIEISKGSISPGKGIGKNLPAIGDVAITGNVVSCSKKFNDIYVDVKLELIYEMATIICHGIETAMVISSKPATNKNL